MSRKSIKIEDVNNGWLVTFYDGDSTSTESYTQYFENLEKALTAVKKWCSDQNLFAWFGE